MVVFERINDIVSFAAVCLLAVIHFFVGRIRFQDDPVGNPWLHAAGGGAIAYVFVYMLPKLAGMQRGLDMQASGSALESFWQNHIYLVALIALLTYYGVYRLEHLASDYRSRKRGKIAFLFTTSVSIAAFAGYSLIVGYFVAEKAPKEPFSVVVITLAMGLHFLGTDHGLRHRDPVLYDRLIRWIISGTLLCGWFLGVTVSLPQSVLAVWFAFMAGGIIIHTFKEELPSEKHGRFLPFFGGAVLFSLLVLTIKYIQHG